MFGLQHQAPAMQGLSLLGFGFVFAGSMEKDGKGLSGDKFGQIVLGG